MLLSLVKKQKQKKTQTQRNTQKQQNKQQQHTIAPVYITGGDAICYCLTVTIVKGCQTVMETVRQHQEGGRWTSTQKYYYQRLRN